MVLGGSSAPYVSLLWLVRVSKAASIGAFIFQFLELFNHIPEEIDYLSRSPFKFVTCLYTWSRYFPLCVQIVNLTLSELIRTNPRPKLCFFTFAAKSVSGQLIGLCVETILAVRATVHALYNCSRRTKQLLFAIMIIGTSLQVTGIALVISELQPGIKGTMCSPKQTSTKALVTYVSGTGIINSTLFVMTISRVTLYRKTGWMRTPVVSLMLRDSILVFVVFIIILAFLVTVELIRIDENMLIWDLAFSWYVALHSIVGCRLVLNMRKLAVQHPRNQRNTSISDSIQLSSLFEDQ